MNDNSVTDQKVIVCYCSGTTETIIDELIAKGVNTLEGIANETGATTGCGSCDYAVAALIAQRV
jgi:bacterioferritin-associated ferredoxin